MGSLVIKSWLADAKPIDEKGNFVHITGRRAGFIGFLLSRLGIDPETKLTVGPERVAFSWASLSGTEYRLIPVQNISSTYYGYAKPWKAAVAGWLTGIAFGYLLADRFYVAESLVIIGWFALLGGIGALVYYVLNRRMTLGFVESSGVINAIAFKRSLVENVQIDEVQARNVSAIVQRCVENKLQRR